MYYCNYCLTTNLRPNAQIVDGKCIACAYSTKNNSASSQLKLLELKRKIKETKRKSRNNNAYDCIVGVSGGKDSTRQAHWVRDRLGLRPLLVCAAYPPQQMSETGAKNLGNLIEMGFDLITATPAPKTSKKLTYESFIKFGNVCKSTELALFSTVPRLAIDFEINMIFWGENPALQVGDSAVLGADDFDGNQLRNLNTLTEGGVTWLQNKVDRFYKSDHYLYPDAIKFFNKKIDIFYLGAAWDDWSSENNAAYAALNGLTLRTDEENITGDLTNASMLDENFTNINMMLKYFKFGFGRATDFVNEKIRSGDISRSEAIPIVTQYDGVCDDTIIDGFSEYVGITQEKFWNIARTWTNKQIFDTSKPGRPSPFFTPGVNYEG